MTIRPRTPFPIACAPDPRETAAMALPHRIAARLARLYWRVRRPRTLGVRALVIDQHDHVALIRHTYITHWYLPGGGVKKGESFADALIRELAEEVALHPVTVERVLGVYTNRSEYKDDHVTVFVVRIERPADAPLMAADSWEIEAAGWFPLDALPEDVSPATLRRITEYRDGRIGNYGDW